MIIVMYLHCSWNVSFQLYGCIAVITGKHCLFLSYGCIALNRILSYLNILASGWGSGLESCLRAYSRRRGRRLVAQTDRSYLSAALLAGTRRSHRHRQRPVIGARRITGKSPSYRVFQDRLLNRQTSTDRHIQNGVTP